ncbi:hypothetical protein L1049_007965 [Liquidambar formosana]|uniref:Pollen Ole e 1 allergen and extensin family protein n=1 Tax=Liquidambar formosana TaxID=63359 RepID=A0AAP0S8Y6_LIQFO
MAQYPTMLLLALFFVVAIPLAHSTITTELTNLVELRVAGVLSCSATGNPVDTTSQGIAGVNVVLVCNGGQTELGQAITNITGAYEVTLHLVDGLSFDTSTCFTTVRLPAVGSCTLLPPTGILQAPITIISLTQSVVGVVGVFVGGLFSVVSL